MKHRFWGCLMIFLLYLTTLFLLVLFPLRMTIKPANLLYQIKKANFYTEIPNFIEQLSKEPQTQVMAKLFNQTFDADELENLLEKNLPDFLNYLYGYTASVKTSIDLTAIKTKLKAQAVNSIAEDLSKALESAPACPAGTKTDNTLVDCRPADFDKYLKSMSSGNFVDQWPDHYNLTNFLNQNKEIQKTRHKFLWLNFGFWGLIFLEIVLIVLFIFNAKNLKVVFGGIGESWLYAALIVLLSNGASYLAATQLLSRYLPDLSGMAKVGENFARSILIHFNYVGLIAAGVVFGVGLILLIVSWALPKPQEQSPTSPVPAGPKPEKPNVS